MNKNIVIEDYIAPIREILADKGHDKKKNLRRLIYRARKINSSHLQKSLTVDQTVERLLQPQWRAKIRRFDIDEWRRVAENIRQRAVEYLGKAAPPEIITYPGFGRFNGRVYKLDGRPVIGCAPDFPRTSGDNLKVILAHEYAHFIRWQKTGVPPEKGPIYSFIYEEGWATWLSIKLLPELDINTMFMSNLHNMINMPNPRGGYIAWCRKNMDLIVTQAQKALKSRDDKDIGRFFQCRRFKDDDTPIRVGYYLGYKLIETMAERYPPRQMLLLRPKVSEIEARLEKLRV